MVEVRGGGSDGGGSGGDGSSDGDGKGCCKWRVVTAWIRSTSIFLHFIRYFILHTHTTVAPVGPCAAM